LTNERTVNKIIVMENVTFDIVVSNKSSGTNHAIKKHRAFTLIELLVVIAIIALLMGILMPALQMVKKQAQGITCRSNLRQYGTATRMYLDENQGTFPNAFTWLFKDGAWGCEWHNADKTLAENPELAGSLWPYLKHKDVHLCSLFNTIAKQTGCSICNGREFPVEPQYGYSMNGLLGTASFFVPDEYRDAVRNTNKEVNVKNPAGVFIFSEENTWRIEGLSGDVFNDNNLISGPGTTEDCFATFHGAPAGDLDNGFANTVFVDGHADRVSAYPPGNTFKMSWPGGSPIPEW